MKKQDFDCRNITNYMLSGSSYQENGIWGKWKLSLEEFKRQTKRT